MNRAIGGKEVNTSRCSVDRLVSQGFQAICCVKIAKVLVAIQPI